MVLSAGKGTAWKMGADGNSVVSSFRSDIGGDTIFPSDGVAANHYPGRGSAKTADLAVAKILIQKKGPNHVKFAVIFLNANEHFASPDYMEKLGMAVRLVLPVPAVSKRGFLPTGKHGG